MKAQIIIIVILLALVSCKKDNIDLEIPTVEPQVEFNTPKTKGSYWTYEWYKIDENGLETPLVIKDSIYVYGDTTINNLNYTVYKGTYFGNSNFTSIERDSSGYIVTHNGGILYSYVNFNDTLSAGFEFWDWYYKMYDNIQVEVPAGSFSSIEARRYYYFASGEPANNCGDDYFTLGKWYAEGVGKVKEHQAYFTELQNCRYREARLIDYYIAP